MPKISPVPEFCQTGFPPPVIATSVTGMMTDLLSKLLPHPATSARQILLAMSVLLGLAYLGDGFGLSLPYPANVVLKASGIILLGVIAAQYRCGWLAAGLWLGAAGDAFLALQPARFDLGILAFGLGHLVYIGLFAHHLRRSGLNGRTGVLAAIGLGVFGLVMLIWLQPHFGELRIAASIYNAIILVMAILAVLGRSHPLAITGALLFVVSDSVLATRQFAGLLEWAGPVVWSTYYLAQAGIALGLTRKAD